MKKTNRVIATMSVFCVILSGGVSLQANMHEMDSSNSAMMEKLEQVSGDKFEVLYLKHMISHHHDAVMMANLVPTHTKRPELIKIAVNIVTAQEKEIATMKTWLRDWHKSEPEKMVDMTMHGELTQLEAAKDAPFDDMFLNMMIEHHKSAVQMSMMAKQKKARPELIKFSEKIIKDQTAEIKQMETWKMSWAKI